MNDDERKKRALAIDRERTRQMGKVLESREGLAVMADLLIALGMGRPASADELHTQRVAHAVLARVIKASEPAALEILARIYGLEKGPR